MRSRCHVRTRWGGGGRHGKISHRGGVSIGGRHVYLNKGRRRDAGLPLTCEVNLETSRPIFSARMAMEVPSMGSHRRLTGGTICWLRYLGRGKTNTTERGEKTKRETNTQGLLGALGLSLIFVRFVAHHTPKYTAMCSTRHGGTVASINGKDNVTNKQQSAPLYTHAIRLLFPLCT